MLDLIAKYDLKKINTLFKYPSIETYHHLDPKGKYIINKLTASNVLFSELEISEKIDGMNIRIIMYKNDYIIGSRNNLIHYSDHSQVDRYGYIIEEKINNYLQSYKDDVTVIFGELFGAEIQNGKSRYADGKLKQYDFRIFDAYSINYDQLNELLSQSIDKLSSWREHNNQPWYTSEQLNQLATIVVPRVPFIKVVDSMPIDANETYEWLKEFKDSHVCQTSEGTTKLFKRAEGVVIRNKDRSYIKKLRIDEYELGFKKSFQ